MVRAVIIVLVSLFAAVAFGQTVPGRFPSNPTGSVPDPKFFVDNFGAVGDGVADDSTPFVNALAACGTAGGGTVQLGPKKYKVVSALTIPVSCRLVGLDGTQPGAQRIRGDNLAGLKYWMIISNPITTGSGTSASRGASIEGLGLASVAYYDAVKVLFDATATIRDWINVRNAFAGTALSNINADIRVVNVTILGFTTCFTSSNTGRVVIDGLLGDCTNGILIDEAHDSTWVRNSQIAYYGTINSFAPENVAISAVANNGSGVVRLTTATSNAITGDIVQLSGLNVQALNKRWTATRISSTSYDLVGSQFTAITTITGTTVTGLSVVPVSSTTNLGVGQTVTGTGIQASTTVAAVWESQNLIWLNQPASANGTGVALTFTNPAFSASAPFTAPVMSLNPNIRPGGKSYSCTNSENIFYSDVAAESPDVAFYFGTGCKWPQCENCAIDADATVAQSPHMIGVWFDGTSMGGRFSGYTTGLGKAIVNTSAGETGHGNVVYASEIGATTVVAEHSGSAPLVLLGNRTTNAQYMFMSDSAGTLTLSGNDFARSVTPYIQSYDAVNRIQGAGTPFVNGTSIYPTISSAPGSLLINGDMMLDQAREGASGTGCNNTLVADRWRCTATAAGLTMTAQRLATSPALAGYPFMLQLTVTATGTPAAGNIGRLEQALEGPMIQSLAWPNGLPVVMDFCANSTVTGTYGAYLRNPGGGLYYLWTYTITATNVWQCFSQVIPSPLGTISAAAGLQLVVGFDIGAGSTFVTAFNGWTAPASGTNVKAAGTVDLSTQANGTAMRWTAVHLRQGTQKSAAYQARDYPTELALAERWYRKSFPEGTAPAQSAGVAGATCVSNPIANGQPSVYVQFDPPMFSSPTITTYNPSAANANWRNVPAASDIAVSVDPATAKSKTGVHIATGATTTTIAQTLCIHYTADTAN